MQQMSKKPTKKTLSSVKTAATKAKNQVILQHITPITSNDKARINGHANGHNLGKNSRSFETRFIPRYDIMPPVPKGLPEPTFSESSNKILKERYLLKGGSLEAIETVSERFWHISYDIASADFDFEASEKE